MSFPEALPAAGRGVCLSLSVGLGRTSHPLSEDEAWASSPPQLRAAPVRQTDLRTPSAKPQHQRLGMEHVEGSGLSEAAEKPHPRPGAEGSGE